MRNIAINNMKALLTIGMVLAHAVQILSFPSAFYKKANDLVNLTTFSGFFFVFGYLYWQQYGGKNPGWPKKIKSIAYLLLTYFVLGTFYTLLHIEPGNWAQHMGQMFFFMWLPPYTEFLVAFALVSVVFWVTQAIWPTIFKSNKKLALVTIGLLTIAAIPFYKWSVFETMLPNNPWLNFSALWLPVKGGLYYPVLPYFIFFFGGLVLAQKKWIFHKGVLGFSLVMAIIYLSLAFSFNFLISRFPVNFFFIAGGVLPVYMLFLLCHAIPRLSLLQIIGENSLYFLASSTIMLFALQQSIAVSNTAAIAIAAFILAASCLLLLTVRVMPVSNYLTLKK